MSAAQKLISSLNQLLHRNTPYQDGASLVPKIDYNELESRLKSAELGRERGLKGLPPNDTTASDEVELKIQSTYQELVDKTAGDVNEALASYNQRIVSFDLTTMTDNIRDAARSTVSEFHAAVTKGLNDLKNAREAVKEKLDDLRYFKEENRLRRSASYPTETGIWIRRAVLLFLFLAESIGNAVFLAKGNEAGMVGAYGEAFAISFLNVGSAVMIGAYLSRHMYGRSAVFKLIGFIFVTGGVVFAAGLNLAVAHYRELSGAGWFGDAGMEAIRRMSENPTALSDFQGWLLFGVGWLFWIIAIVDAHTMDDNFPGYGKVARALKDARDDYADFKTDVIDELSELRQDGEDEIKSVRAQLGEVFSQVGSLFNMRRALLNDYGLFSEQALRLFNQSLETYRNMNRDARDSAPASFNKELTLGIPRYGEDIVSVNMETLSSQVDQGRRELDDALNQFYAEYKTALEQFKRLDDIEAEVSDQSNSKESQ